MPDLFLHSALSIIDDMLHLLKWSYNYNLLEFACLENSEGVYYWYAFKYDDFLQEQTTTSGTN